MKTRTFKRVRRETGEVLLGARVGSIFDQLQTLHDTRVHVFKHENLNVSVADLLSASLCSVVYYRSHKQLIKL